MRRLLLLALTLAASPAAAAVPSGCQEDYASCKEDCTIEYGGSSRALGQLTRCIGQCQQTLNTCAQKHSSLKIPAGVANERARKGEPDADVAGEPKRGGGKTAPAAEAAPAPSKSPAVTRQGVYRASEAEAEAEAAPAPKPAPAPAPEPEEDEGLAPMNDVPPPAPKRVAKPAPVAKPSRPESPPEPKRKDISEWDPNGD